VNCVLVHLEQVLLQNNKVGDLANLDGHYLIFHPKRIGAIARIGFDHPAERWIIRADCDLGTAITQ